MIKREEVEDLLLICDQRPVLVPSRVSVDSDTLAELARTWLAVDSAEEAACGDCDDGVFNGQPCEYCGGAGKFKLVPEADSGGEG